jgi:quinol monooxygenase YgiN
MMHATTDTLVMIAELTIAPGKLDMFLDYTVPNLAVSREWPGNLQFDMLIEADSPQTIRFYEVWESAAAQQAYMAWRVQAGDLTTLMGFLSAPPTFTALRSIAA